MAKKTHYAIRKGHLSMMIVNSWEKCEELVKGFSGAQFKGFTCKVDAEIYLAKYTPDDEDQRGEFIPPQTEKKDKYGYWKPRYFQEQGVRCAYYGRTIGENYVQSSDTTTPW